MAMHMRKECKKRERQNRERERTTRNIACGGQHFPVFLLFFFISFAGYDSAGVKLVLMINIELTASHLTGRT